MLVYLKNLYHKEEYRSVSNHQYLLKTVNIINCVEEGICINRQRVVKKKYVFVSTSRPDEQNGFRVSWKLCLNLCSPKWLRLAALRRVWSSLLHSTTVDGKEEFLKNSCLVWNRVLLS